MQAISSERAQELEVGEADVYGYAEPLVDIAEMVRDKLVVIDPSATTLYGRMQGPMSLLRCQPQHDQLSVRRGKAGLSVRAIERFALLVREARSD